jgi:hypothetical protein
MEGDDVLFDVLGAGDASDGTTLDCAEGSMLGDAVFNVTGSCEGIEEIST